VAFWLGNLGYLKKDATNSPQSSAPDKSEKCGWIRDQPFAVLADNRHPVPSTSGRFQPGAIGRGRPEASIRGYAEIKVEIGNE